MDLLSLTALLLSIRRGEADSSRSAEARLSGEYVRLPAGVAPQQSTATKKHTGFLGKRQAFGLADSLRVFADHDAGDTQVGSGIVSVNVVVPSRGQDGNPIELICFVSVRRGARESDGDRASLHTVLAVAATNPCPPSGVDCCRGSAVQTSDVGRQSFGLKPNSSDIAIVGFIFTAYECACAHFANSLYMLSVLSVCCRVNNYVYPVL